MEGKQKRKRHIKKGTKERRGRIIVRNLPFKVTEESLRSHFEKFGPITEINILKRPDGKLVGCAFIQYQVVQNAAKAIFHTSGKPFLDRPIICDWALGKNTYIKNIMTAIQNEEQSEETIEIKEEPDIKKEIKEEKCIDDEGNVVVSDSESEKEIKEESDDESSPSSENDSESDSGDDDKVDDEEEPEEKKSRFVSNDVLEGKTVFIKNVPFSATNDDLKNCMSQFGPLNYALICVDPITEHSKGTAFVKFMNSEDAENCLEAGTELKLLGSILDCHRALTKNDLQNKNKKPENRDSRNLYLVKEGVILAGSKAAESVSASDMAKRLELERWKTQILRNLNMFVSKFRLVIHNLPISYDDNKLRQLVAKYAGAKAVIKESKVMRNMKVVDASGRGTPKGFGFVSFENHEDALKVIRALNNNPNVFSESKRPIVSFSIENKAILNARNRRLEKSKVHNPNFKAKETVDDQTKNKHKKIGVKKQNVNNKMGSVEENSANFVGLTAKVGINKMRSKLKLKSQAKLHHENLKKKKKLQKNMKKSFQQSKEEFIRQPQQKKNTKKKNMESDNFSNLVNKYKTKLIDNKKVTKSKWYDV